MKRYLTSAASCILALGLFHLGASVFVRRSNLFLLEKTRAIAEAGLLALPNPVTQPPLASWEAALCGAIFFTVTSGAFVLASALVAPFLYRQGVLSRKTATGLHGLFLVGCLLSLGIRSETSPLLLGSVGAYLVLLPAGQQATGPRFKPLLFHALIPVILALCIAGTHLVLPRGLFSGFRDAFLFDNPAGNAVRHFYYTYTLFPAEAFKGMSQKSQVTVNVEGESPKAHSAIRRLGHLSLPGGPTDYTLKRGRDTVTLAAPGATRTVAARDFFREPAKAFRAFSATADPFGPLRSFTWFSLFTAFPLLFYLLFHTSVTLALGLFLPLPTAARAATVTVASCALLFVALLAVGLSQPDSTTRALDALARTKTHKATAGEVIFRAAAHPSALVRYRAALAAPRIRDPRLRRHILTTLSRDPDTNVVCQALGAMGQTKDKGYLIPLEKAVATRPQWYVQWYGYRAMGRLGWHQSPK
ncbi:HEAT repeat domain-containing protein [Desulfoluna butyratoxydans]|uniref:Armadillo-type fold n=1 Tax=Desulfoluna butyratoxydans TaxID=231438 RepID=A0A4U8YR47_9BACT|nr:HEAT repeat domain-containing protein [Desulfoluna butyratoxydans]VFQ46340.1 armadillo-type fold [Desulfoluna butyratoxydans]